jgi:hypothetical protein
VGVVGVVSPLHNATQLGGRETATHGGPCPTGLADGHYGHEYR